ncbi:MAG TPA: carboxypeptidase regulatory-like domain-containing protein, partial [Candidatus Sulfotelmatobacter sp.]|nr:carboxypeptidase regulatory-like domain-containing protein [Candidatus Sulfotelmatobacter sp.]
MKRLYLDLGAALAVALALSMPALSQKSQSAAPAATVMGTVTDVNGDVIPNATVVLKEVEGIDP